MLTVALGIDGVERRTQWVPGQEADISHSPKLREKENEPAF